MLTCRLPARPRASSHVLVCKAEESAPNKLRKLLKQPGILVMPCCFDGLSAKLVQRAGFDLTFMSGFATSAAKLGLPDTGYMSYGEMVDAGRDICSAVSIPVIGDGDTGYGNAMNVKRTVRGYAQAGFASVMIEDQVAPKRCGHTRGKQVVSREEAIQRVQAAVDARDEGADILILARTDARGCISMDEALERVRLYEKVGADIVFLEAPQSIEEMKMHCEAAPNTPKLANMLEGGKTPVLPPKELEKMGYKIAAYPLTLVSTAVKAMNKALESLKEGRPVDDILDFAELRDIVGFNDYYAEEERYKL
ncbi:hypothetical protein GUITHDRAFT_67257 [Guillardia theta CCMP2712]|uniref:Carboxyvinyl-carboxyphosphonate phosphorylmutase n=1 Tax=Guillardia theta (strain CCMP2712) TaxID=905079 RepID=L1JQK1_GUITC|nr:hypothetical protein GUITHDRAFT_67257 [Guillardia theta CCMP2712]EKX50358.1 hypothetical protein GUITHDRAFT_67257 [Guillardia theta CCMP2712]|eukprot:XP_005837338.1 hypothetical protein GUITHDRAFT_67257 [Guillardia theta CCMP2712]